LCQLSEKSSQAGVERSSNHGCKTPVYKTGAQNAQGVDTQEVTGRTENSLDTHLAISLQEYPELGQLVERWPDLSEHVRQAILCLLK